MQVWLEIAIPQVYENLNKALELDPELAEVHYINGVMAMMAEWDWDKAEKEFVKAIAINPNLSFARLHYSHLLYGLQRQEEARRQADTAYMQDNLNPLVQSTYSVALTCGWECKSALSVLENLLAKEPDNYLANSATEGAALQCGDFNRLLEATKHMVKVGFPNDFNEMELNRIEKIYNENGFNSAYTEIVQKLEILAETEVVLPIDMAFKNYVINRDDKTMEWIEKGLELHDFSLIYIGTGFMNFTRLYDNPRFIEVLNKMNLPLPKN